MVRSRWSFVQVPAAAQRAPPARCAAKPAVTIAASGMGAPQSSQPDRPEVAQPEIALTAKQPPYRAGRMADRRTTFSSTAFTQDRARRAGPPAGPGNRSVRCRNGVRVPELASALSSLCWLARRPSGAISRSRYSAPGRIVLVVVLSSSRPAPSTCRQAMTSAPANDVAPPRGQGRRRYQSKRRAGFATRPGLPACRRYVAGRYDRAGPEPDRRSLAI